MKVISLNVSRLSASKLTSSLLLGYCILALPGIASAFEVYNSTISPFTISINNHCSSEFGNVPVLHSRAINETELMNLCHQNTNNCVGRIHESTDCSGQEIGSFIFDEDGLVKGSSATHAQGYSVNPIVYMNLVVVGQE